MNMHISKLASSYKLHDLQPQKNCNGERIKLPMHETTRRRANEVEDGPRKRDEGTKELNITHTSINC